MAETTQALQDNAPSTASLIESNLKKGQIKEAFTNFNLFFNTMYDYRSPLTQLQSQWSEIEIENSKGNITKEFYELRQNQIVSGILYQLDELKKDIAQYVNVQQGGGVMNGFQERKEAAKEILEHRLKRQYTVIAEFESAQSNVIFLLQDNYTQRKVIARLLKLPEITENIKKEIDKVIRLKHRNIIKILDVSIDHFPFFIITEYISGVILENALEKVGKRPPSQVVNWLQQLADALDYLRQKNILHSNLSPSQIYIDDENMAIISPFSITRAGVSERPLKGFREDCQYFSPELLLSDGVLLTMAQTRLSDQFSLGLIAYKMLTGEDLFNGNSIQETIEDRLFFLKDIEEQRKRLGKIHPEALIKIIRQLLRIKPYEGFDSIHELLDEFHLLTSKKIDDTSILRKSYRRCMQRNSDFIFDFYNAFFAKEKEIEKLSTQPLKIRDLFRNRERQTTMFQMGMDILIDLDSQKDLLKRVILSDSHRNFPPSVFDVFLETLIETAQHNEVPKNWTAEVENAWRRMKNEAMDFIGGLL